MVELGVHVGVFFTSAEHELYDVSREWRELNPAAFSLGARVGFYPLGALGAELEGGWAPTRTTDGAFTSLAHARAHALAQLPLYSVVPFALIGGGALATAGAALGGDVDPAVHFGGGLKVLITRWLGARVDGRASVTPALGDLGGRTVHGELLFNLVITLNRPLRDRDDDGWYDPGQPSARIDACPGRPGVAAQRGCPDRDGDGVRDLEDMCVDTAGLRERDGCPPLVDSDGDGFFDPGQHAIPARRDDQCPARAGAPEYQGCPAPDTDGDGFDDLEDRCVDEPETVNGYEDSDGCPDSLPVPVLQILGTIRGIHFPFLSAELIEDSMPILDRAARVLAEYPELRLEIQGHTDTDGDPAFNKELSRRRADAVRDELIARGVSAVRLSAVGYGGEQPIADNATENGRAQNRRIEFRLLDERGAPLEVTR